jgi:hypothetical protein
MTSNPLNLKTDWTSYKIGISLFALFLLRTTFGLCSEFWSDDELQIFLLGFKYFTTDAWPYFGPDVVYKGGQIPGALQALLIGAPLKLVPVLEAPYVLLNLLSMAGLIILFIYIHKKMPSIPWWVILFWLMLAPWTIYLGTHIVNPSYVLFGACLFFVAFLEIVPFTNANWWSRNLSFFILGFSLFWIFQLHMSYVVLSPFIAYAFYWGAKDSFKRMAKYLVYFGLGSLSTALLVIPTFIFYGIGEKGMGGSTNNIVFTPANFFEIGNLVLRLFSFASFEFNRFIGLSTEEKMTIFKLYPWTIPSILLVAITGFAQVGLMLFQFFKYKGQQTDMKFMKWLLLFTVGFLWLSFLFSAKDPASHTIYLFLPLIMVFYFLSLEKIIHVKWMIPFITVFYVSCFTFHLVMGIEKHQKVSFITQLPKVQDAFKQHKYTVLGIRRSDLKGCCY